MQFIGSMFQPALLLVIYLLLITTVDTAPQGPNLLRNAGFESGAISPWTVSQSSLYTTTDVSSPSITGKYAFHARIKDTDAVSLDQSLTHLRTSASYRFAFDYVADAPISVDVYISQGNGGQQYLLTVCTATRSCKGHYQHRWIAMKANAGFQVQIQPRPGPAGRFTNLTLDNFVVRYLNDDD